MKHSQPQPRTQRAGRAWLWALLAGLPLAGFTSWTAPQDADPALEEARLSLEQLYETRRLISQERSTWQVAKELLTDEIDLAGKELEGLRAQITEKQQESTDAEAAVQELLTSSEASTLATQEMEARIPAWEARLRVLIPRLPVPLQDELRTLTQSLPKEGEETTLSPSKRFITVVFLLTQINKYHGEVHLASETLTLPDGQQVNVSTLYLGVSQGYFVTQDGSMAGLGLSGEHGWEWTPKPEAAEEIAKAVAILSNEHPAGYATVPVRVQ